ncbi:ABC transporter ATP-binding protein [Acrocarpospora catenulata]|uniref:ABC transporter ATP-binding protein n=1 Tax=Acrocarpospora catenulata TaxID=2836182 RepID=UPI002023B3F4|nr:ABC transporter ATP-binding protein [Acrocarpospora catenulata]
MTLLEVNGLVVRYGRLTAVHGLDLTVAEGEVAILLGANGAGKSSTLGAISGVVPVAAGEVLFAGRRLSGRPPHVIARSGLVQVAEGRRIIGPLTVRENLELGGYAVRSARLRGERIRMVTDLFPELGPLADRPGGLLSGGEQQMLAIGRALMADPRLLMLDEPSMGLAPVVTDRVIDAVADIAARGTAILMVEQNVSAAFRVATTAHVMERGEITLSGPASEVAGSPHVLRAFLGTADTPQVIEETTP